VTLKPGLGSLKVIGTDADLSAARNFLLTFHSNHGPISRTISEINGDVSRKSQIGKLEFGAGAGGKKTRVMRLPGREKSLTISSAVWIQ